MPLVPVCLRVTTHALIAIVLGAAGVVDSHSCYVCGGAEDGAGQLQTTFPGATFPPCDFGRATRRCPIEYKGCLTQNNGSRTMKTCGHVAMNTCKTANKVEYCYCQGDLCNGGGHVAMPLDDDEEDDADGDRAEGSATGPHRFETPVRPVPPPAGNHCSLPTPSPLLLILLLLLLPASIFEGRQVRRASGG